MTRFTWRTKAGYTDAAFVCASEIMTIETASEDGLTTDCNNRLETFNTKRIRGRDER
jgi:hypothetical protein